MFRRYHAGGMQRDPLGDQININTRMIQRLDARSAAIRETRSGQAHTDSNGVCADPEQPGTAEASREEQEKEKAPPMQL